MEMSHVKYEICLDNNYQLSGANPPTDHNSVFRKDFPKQTQSTVMKKTVTESTFRTCQDIFDWIYYA